MTKTNYNEIIAYCLSKGVGFEFNKRFPNENRVECVFNINIEIDNTFREDKRVVYNITTDEDETAKILNMLDVYLSLDPFKNSQL